MSSDNQSNRPALEPEHENDSAADLESDVIGHEGGGVPHLYQLPQLYKVRLFCLRAKPLGKQDHCRLQRVKLTVKINLALIINRLVQWSKLNKDASLM